MLSQKEKQKMESFCDKIMLKKYTANQEQNKLVDYKNKHIDLLNVRKVGNLQFRDQDEAWLKSLFKRTQPDGFKDFYHDMLKRAIKQEEQSENQQFSDSKKKNEKSQAEDPVQAFFAELMDAFYQINFYNLLQWQIGF